MVPVSLCLILGFQASALPQATLGTGVPQPQRKQSLLSEIVGRPSGANGYEEYLAAADLSLDPAIRLLTNWMPGQLNQLEERRSALIEQKNSKQTDRALLDILRADIEQVDGEIALLKSLNVATALQADLALDQRATRAWQLVDAGNAKAAFEPRTSLQLTTAFPEFAAFKQLAKTGPRIVRARLSKGDGAGAAHLIASEYRFCRRSCTGVLISLLVSIAMTSITTASLERVSPRLPYSGLSEIEAALEETLADTEMMVRGFEGEAHIGRALEEVLLAGKTPEESGWKDLGFDDDFARKVLQMSLDQRRALVREVASAQKKHIQAQIDTLNLPESEWKVPELNTTGLSPTAGMLLSLITPDFEGVIKALAKYRTQLRLARLQVKAAKWTWLHRRVPSTLNDFTPVEDRLDPLSRQSFQYQKTGANSFRIFSRGNADLGEIGLKYIKTDKKAGGAAP